MERAPAASLLLVVAAAVGSLVCAGRDANGPAAAPGGVSREVAAVDVGATRERWALEWRRPPRLVCGPDEVEMAITCPCTGFAYGEMGELDLIRRRPGRADDRLALTPLFGGEENPAWQERLAVLQRWPRGDSDFVMADSVDLGAIVRARPATRVIVPGDYDHDGRATEFPLQVGTLPCGKRQAVLVGVSGADSSLHAFTSVAHPERPLVLSTRLWERLRRSDGTTTGVEWPCRDHGAVTQTEVRLSAGPAGIDGVRTEYACAEDGARGGQLSSERI